MEALINDQWLSRLFSETFVGALTVTQSLCIVFQCSLWLWFSLEITTLPFIYYLKTKSFGHSDVSRRIVISVYRYGYPNSGAQKRKCTFIYCNVLSQAMFLNLSKVCFQARTHTLLLMMMMNFFCRMVDRRKVFSLISSWDHCQRSSPSRISDTPRARFEPAQNLSSGF